LPENLSETPARGLQPNRHMAVLGVHPSEQLVDLLLECHSEIRRMMRVARRLALSGPRAFSELREAAESVRAFCVECLPQHEREEELIMLRLAGRTAELDAAFAELASQHDATASEVARLVALCDVIACDPRRLTHHARELSALAARLEATFTAHLALEERTLFPLLRALPLAKHDEILQEIRTRHPW
jgi:hemerythrin-like domain-containing protein